MKTSSTLKAVCLKLDMELLARVDKQRSQRLGITHPDPVTRTQFLREATEWYCDFVDDRYSKKYELLQEIKQTQEEDTPIGFYVDDGRESGWI
jgi:hypothetical protein